jgi:hypothetical protein
MADRAVSAGCQVGAVFRVSIPGIRGIGYRPSRSAGLQACDKSIVWLPPLGGRPTPAAIFRLKAEATGDYIVFRGRPRPPLLEARAVKEATLIWSRLRIAFQR